MTNNISTFIGSIFIGIMGLFAIIKHKSLGTKIALFWSKTIKISSLSSEKNIQFNQHMALIVGIIFIVLAIMMLYQTLK